MVIHHFKNPLLFLIHHSLVGMHNVADTLYNEDLSMLYTYRQTPPPPLPD